MLEEKNLSYDALTDWELDGVIPDWEQLQIMATNRNRLQELVDRYTRMLEECESDERIRYPSSNWRPSRATESAPDENED